MYTVSYLWLTAANVFQSNTCILSRENISLFPPQYMSEWKGLYVQTTQKGYTWTRKAQK